ncbi:MAG: histidine--tRNA ligase [Saprospiraceae bacterium]|nr:histidine--tRNA ligase [Saprospiraceae bacterium]
MKKVQLAKGTRDFLPAQARRRKFIFDVLERSFQRYGFQPLETPALENLDTLMGKYGEEGDQLLFKVLNSGDFTRALGETGLAGKSLRELSLLLCEKGLRYDLTVPLARVVAMNRHEIALPFKRYQIQPVWRADRPQRGRYREFYQCDADVLGSGSLLCEAELVQLYDEAFCELGIPVAIHINHRKVLEGLAQEAGIADRFAEFTVEVDKLEKTGPEAFEQALRGLGLEAAAVRRILGHLTAKDPEGIAVNDLARTGAEEILSVKRFLGGTPLKNELVFDPALARGLSYYTGCIFEVKPLGVQMGSLGGGGRYDELTAIFGLPGVSGVGISFGADRIYDVLTELDRFPAQLGGMPRALLAPLSERAQLYAFRLATELRRQGIPVDVYPEVARLKKQFAHAERLDVPFVVILGDDERNAETAQVKDQRTGEQHCIPAAQLAAHLG